MNEVNTDLVLEDGISNFFHKPANCAHIRFIFLVPRSAGAMRQGLQLVFDSFKSTGMCSAKTLANNEWVVLTQTGPFVARIRHRCPWRPLLLRVYPTAQEQTRSFLLPLAISVNVSDGALKRKDIALPRVFSETRPGKTLFVQPSISLP